MKTPMAISLTESELCNLATVDTDYDSNSDDEWVLTEGGSIVRCDVSGMNKELATVPTGIQSAQPLSVLQFRRIAAVSARST